MASSKEYLNFVLEEFANEDITYKPMMGEYILYYKGKIFGGIYDDRLLVKPVNTAVSLIPNVVYQKPYDGAKDMILIENLDDKEFLSTLIIAMYKELPTPNKK